MSNPAVPRVPEGPDPSAAPGPGVDPDAPNPFGPDGPNVREDDPTGGQYDPGPIPLTPAPLPLDDDDYAPDET